MPFILPIFYDTKNNPNIFFSFFRFIMVPVTVYQITIVMMIWRREMVIMTLDKQSDVAIPFIDKG